MIDGLLEKSDPLDGLRHPFRGVLDQLIRELAKRDLEGTLAWIDGKFPAQRFEFYQSIIGQVMGDRPPLEKLGFFEAHGFERIEISGYAATLMFSQNIRPMDTETAIALQSKNVPREDGLLGAARIVSLPRTSTILSLRGPPWPKSKPMAVVCPPHIPSIS